MRRKFPPSDILLLGILVLCVGASLAAVDFYSRGEGREALNAQGALSGYWLLPRGYGGAVASKPPLLHWLIAAISFPLGQVTEFTARLPSFVSALAVGWFVFRCAPPSRRWVVLLVLMSSFEWVRAAVSCRVDMVHAAMLAAALMLWPYLRSVQSKRWRMVVVGASLTAASVLTKGPVALVISAIVFLAWYWLEERHHGVSWARFLKNLARWLGLATIISGIWYAMAIILGGEEFRNTFWSENVERFVGTADSVPHKHGVAYLGAVLFAGLLPWSLIAPVFAVQRHGVRPQWAALMIFARRLRENGLFRGRTRGLGALRSRLSALPAVDRYAVLVGTVVFFFYCIPGSKRGVYLLVGYPFYAILLGRLLERLIATGSVRGLQRLFAIITLGVAGILLGGSVLGIVGGVLIPEDAPTWVSRALSLLAVMGVGSRSPLAWIALAAGLGYGVVSWRRARQSLLASPLEQGDKVEKTRVFIARQLDREVLEENRCGVIRCLTCAVAIILMIQANIQAPVSHYWSEQLIGEKVREFVPANARLVSWHREFYGASLYAGRTIVTVGETPAAGDYCLLRAVDLPALRTELPQPLQPVFVSRIMRGFGGRDTVLLVRIESPGAGLGSV